MRDMTGTAWTPQHAHAWTVALTAVAGVVLTGEAQPTARSVA